jgi:hypothetical protein
MKIRFTTLIEIDESEYPNISKNQIREEVLTYMKTYADECLERAKEWLCGENYREVKK